MHAASFEPGVWAVVMSQEWKAQLFGSIAVATWVIYAVTFFPFEMPKDYAIQWIFALAALGGLLVTSYCVYRRTKRWRECSLASNVVLLGIYIVYWFSTLELARRTKPDLSGLASVQHLVGQGFDIAESLWTRGAFVAASQMFYFEIVMPLLQIVLIAYFAFALSKRT